MSVRAFKSDVALSESAEHSKGQLFKKIRRAKGAWLGPNWGPMGGWL